MPRKLKALEFSHGFGPRDEYETPLKGFRSDVIAELDDGCRYALYFYDPVRLRQELEGEVAAGSPFLAEPGLIVLPEVTREAMENAAAELCSRGFFDSFQPLSISITTP